MRTPEDTAPVSRRSLLVGSVAVGAGLGIGFGRSAAGAEPDPGRPRNVIDAHAHLYHHSRPTWADDDRKLIEAGDRLGIDQFCCSILTPRRPATAEGFRDCNRWVADAMKRFPGRVLGYCYVNPGHTREALEEVRRYVEDRGFVGVKLYNEYRCTDPVVFPVVELAIELRVPILHHAGHSHYFVEEQPHISDGGRLAELSRRYPEAMLICAHICGGGDWEWTIKALRDAPGVSLDLSGSVTDDGVVEMAARVLGADRLLFACDMSMTASVGRLRGAELSPAERRKVLGENMERLLGAPANMIIDVNAYLGNFAFRRLRHNTAGSLLKLMDARKIDRAIVSSASAITYRNAQSGNEEIDAEVKAHRDRLIPFAVINPTYAGWEDDLKTCHERSDMRGLRLYPGWHKYKLSDPRCLDLVRAAAARGLVVSIPIRVEDHRQRSWLVDVPDVALDDVAALVRACPEAKFLLLNGIGYVRSPLGRKDSGLPANYRIEISRLTAFLDDELGTLVNSMGPDRIVFGTGMPFSYPDPALLKLEVLAVGPEQKERIAWRNAAEWLPGD